MFDLSGKAALVTGASGGIGGEIARALHAQGASVGLSGTRVEPLEALAAELGERAHVLPCNLGDAEAVKALPGEASAAMGSLDILVNNAGIITRGKITEASDGDFARSMAINVEAPFRLCRAAIPIMADQGSGAIVNVASCWGLSPGPEHPIYVMSKAALASMTQCLGMDHARQGIRVNAVCPNEMNTPMIRSGFEIRGLDPDQAIDELNASVPLGRIAEPEEIADVVLFLASDQAQYLCGALIEANGGKSVQ